MKAVTLYRPGFLENALSDFDRYMGSFFGDNFFAPAERAFGRNAGFHPPAMDIRETEAAYIIEAELPGFDEKDVEVRLDSSTLTIESKKEDARSEDSSAKSDRSYLVRERRLSSFSRSFKLPENADHEGISASFRNGVLSLEIAKKAEAQKRVIPISKT